MEELGKLEAGLHHVGFGSLLIARRRGRFVLPAAEAFFKAEPETVLGKGIALGGPLIVEGVGPVHVPVDAEPFLEEHGEGRIGIDGVAVHGLLEPEGCLAVVLGRAPAVPVHEAEQALRLGIAGFGHGLDVLEAGALACAFGRRSAESLCIELARFALLPLALVLVLLAHIWLSFAVAASRGLPVSYRRKGKEGRLPVTFLASLPEAEKGGAEISRLAKAPRRASCAPSALGYIAFKPTHGLA